MTEFSARFSRKWTSKSASTCTMSLDLYHTLIQSYDALTDKQGLTPEDVRFRGFDGNNESKRWAFTEHLQKQGKWKETLTGGVNSHSMTTMSLYPRMLAKFQPIRQEKRYSRLALETGN